MFWLNFQVLTNARIPNFETGIKRIMNLQARWNGLLRGRSMHGVIGLEISLSQIHMAQLSCNNGQLSLSASMSLDHGSNPTEVWQDKGQFRQLMLAARKGGEFRGRQIVAALPSSLVRVMPVSYEPAAGESDDESIAKLLSERIGSDADNFVVDYMPVHTLQKSRTRLALVALCREETVVAYLDALTHAGCEVVALEIGPIAIHRLINTVMADLPPQNTLVVNCGRQCSYLTLVADNRLLADDEIGFGEDAIVNALCSSLDIDPALALKMIVDTALDPKASDEENDAGRWISEIIYPEFQRLASEIERGLVYANSESRGSRRSSVYLLGGIARWRGADRLLQSILGVPVAIVPSPLALFGQPDAESAPELAVATGLALHSFDNVSPTSASNAA